MKSVLRGGHYQMRVLSAVMLIACVAMLAGCPKDRWAKAAALSDDFAAACQGAQQTEISVYRKGYVPVDDHIAIQKVFDQLGKSGQTLDAAIKAGSDANTTTAAFNAAIITMQTALTTTAAHIHNPEALAEVQFALNQAKFILDTIQATAQGSPPPPAPAPSPVPAS